MTTLDIRNRFEEKFVVIDHGPDADDYDCLPDQWQEWFSEYLEPHQIEVIFSFISEEVDKVIKDIRQIVIDSDAPYTTEEARKTANYYKSQILEKLESTFYSDKQKEK